jgi:hypothetical protein
LNDQSREFVFSPSSWGDIALGEAFDKPGESMAKDEGDIDRRGKGSVWLSDMRRLDASLNVLLGILNCSCDRTLGAVDVVAG